MGGICRENSRFSLCEANPQAVHEQMPLLQAELLDDEYLPYAATLLSLLAHAYWRLGNSYYTLRMSMVSAYLPESILTPWQIVNSRLGRFNDKVNLPFQNAYDLFLNNWKFIDQKNQVNPDGSYDKNQLLIENIEPLIPSFGNQAERVFYMSFVEMHLYASKMIMPITRLQDGILSDDFKIVCQGLDEITGLVKMCTKVPQDFVPTLDFVMNSYKDGESRDKIKQAFANAIEHGAPFDLELALTTAKGNEIWLRAKGNMEMVNNAPVRLYGMLQDITERKMQEESIKEYQQKLDAFFNSTNDIIVLLGPDMRILAYNKLLKDFVSAFLNRNIEAGDNILEYMPVDTHDSFSKNFRIALNGETIEETVFTPFKGEKHSWWHGKFMPIKSKEGTIFGVAFVDTNVTETKQKERALEEYEQKLAAFFNSGSDIVVLLAPDMSILAYNGMAEQFAQNFLQKQVTIGDTVVNYLHPATIEAFQSAFGIAISGEDFEEEMQVPFEDENYRWWHSKFTPMKNAAGEIIGVAFTDTNISEQKKQELAIQEQEQKLSAYFKSSNDIIVLLDLKLNILAFNKVAASFAEKFVLREVHEGDKMLDYILPSMQEKFKKACNAALKGENVQEIVFAPYDDMRFTWWHCKFSPITNNEGAVTGIAFTNTNITERKNADMELIKSEQTFSSLVQNSPGVVFRFHVKKDKSFFFSYVSHRMREVFDLELPLNTPHCFDHVNFINKEKFFNSIALCVQDLSNWEYDGQLMGDNGVIKWFNGKATPVVQEDEIVFIGILLDITAQKQAELEDQLMYNLLVNFNEADTMKEALTGLIASVNTHFNFNYAEAWSLSIDNTSLMLKAEFPIRADYEAFKQDQLEKKLNIKGLGLPGAAWERKEMIYWKDLQDAPLVQKDIVKAAGYSSAMALPVFFKNEVIAILTFFAAKPFTSNQLSGGFWFKLSMEMGNSIQKKKTEEELDNFFNLAPNFLAIAGFDGYFKKVNPTFTRLLGYSNEELISIPFIELVHPEDWIDAENAIGKLISGSSINEFEIRFITKNGQLKWLSWSCIGLVSENVIYAAAKDITLHKEFEDQRNQVMEELKTNNEDLKQFSYVTSHNLRAPLTNLLAMVQLINLDNITHERTKKLVAGFKTSTNQLNETLSDLINILVIKDAKNKEALSLINFNEIYNRVILSLKQSVLDSNTTIETNFREAEFVKFNGFFMESIMHHLITNAIKFASPNRKPTIKIYTTLHRGATQLIISDNGLGIDMKYAKEHIFGLHQRFHIHKEGRGFGLHLIHSQITALGGKINVDSEVDKGTTFTITFKKQL